MYAAGTLPTKVTECSVDSYGKLLALGFCDDTATTNCVNAIKKITVNDTEFTKDTLSWMSNKGTIWNTESTYGTNGRYQALKYVLDTISVKDSKNADITVTGNTFAMPASDVTVSAVFKANAPAEDGTVSIDSIKMETDFFGSNWYFTFPENKDYVSKITSVSVNGTAWESKSFDPSDGGAYRADKSNSRLTFAQKSYGSKPALKSGDVITITVGAGQKDYDGVSSATGAANSNNNSNVTVYGALVEKGKEPADSDWKEMDNDSDINIVGSKSKVNIVPDTSKGTSKDADSGMEGVYLTISSALTLNGTPNAIGQY